MSYNELYEVSRAGSIQSARVVVPVLVDLLRPQSVIDVGCGEGWWLSVFQEHGVSTVTGIDGSHIDTDRLLIPQSSFRPHNLQRITTKTATPHDVAISLEVAEHLPEERAANFVEFLIACAPVIVFSAAMPRQGGMGHVNEQWPGYWANLFAQRGYRGTGALRWKFWMDPRIEHWYQQLFVYATDTAIEANPALRALMDSPLASPWPVIHPVLWESRA